MYAEYCTWIHVVLQCVTCAHAHRCVPCQYFPPLHCYGTLSRHTNSWPPFVSRCIELDHIKLTFIVVHSPSWPHGVQLRLDRSKPAEVLPQRYWCGTLMAPKHAALKKLSSKLCTVARCICDEVPASPMADIGGSRCTNYWRTDNIQQRKWRLTGSWGLWHLNRTCFACLSRQWDADSRFGNGLGSCKYFGAWRNFMLDGWMHKSFHHSWWCGTDPSCELAENIWKYFGVFDFWWFEMVSDGFRMR